MSTNYLDLDKIFNYYTWPRVGPALHNIGDVLQSLRLKKYYCKMTFGLSCPTQKIAAIKDIMNHQKRFSSTACLTGTYAWIVTVFQMNKFHAYTQVWQAVRKQLLMVAHVNTTYKMEQKLNDNRFNLPIIVIIKKLRKHYFILVRNKLVILSRTCIQSFYYNHFELMGNLILICSRYNFCLCALPRS